MENNENMVMFEEVNMENEVEVTEGSGSNMGVAALIGAAVTAVAFIAVPKIKKGYKHLKEKHEQKKLQKNSKKTEAEPVDVEYVEEEN